MNGYSLDNYITDQDYFASYTYRGIGADCNGCGPIAVYNLLNYLKMEKPIGTIIEEMNKMYFFKIPGPTSMKVLGKYLYDNFKYVENFYGRKNVISMMSNVPYGIIRYNESHVPHLIFFYHLDDRKCRFFNVDDGLEDVELYIDEFAKRLLPGYSVLIYPHT